MLPGMQTGQITKELRPSWEPLVTLVGREVVGCFTWKHVVRLDDGTAVHVYRHAATEAFLLLGDDNRAFACKDGDYEEVTPSAALEAAFRGWEDARPRPRDPDAVRALLTRHGIATGEPAA